MVYACLHYYYIVLYTYMYVLLIVFIYCYIIKWMYIITTKWIKPYYAYKHYAYDAILSCLCCFINCDAEYDLKYDAY